MKDEALISVIIPVFNGEKYLAAAIESVLGQTYRPIEIIVVDDGSTDGSREIAERFAATVHYAFQSHQGPGAARNKGVELAGGIFCAFIDADDLWVEHKLIRQMAAFKSNTEVDMVFSLMEQFHSPELYKEIASKLTGHGKILAGYSPGSLLVKRGAFLRAGPFDIQWRIGEFIAWYSMAIDKGLKSHLVPEVLARRRLHGANMTLRERTATADYVKILKASLDRRRNSGSEEIRADTL